MIPRGVPPAPSAKPPGSPPLLTAALAAGQRPCAAFFYCELLCRDTSRARDRPARVECASARGAPVASFVGIDFGTTNSAIAVADDRGPPSLAAFPRREGPTSTFRSILYFDPERRGALTGPQAIEGYLEGDGEGRLIQSLKSYLASRLFTATSVFSRRWTLEDMVAQILIGLRDGARRQFPGLGASALVGRPVRFSNAAGEEDNEFALGRLREAFAKAGFARVEFEYEPVAAAWHYESGLDHDELVLIADFGGGTSDFSLMRVGPGLRGASAKRRILGTEGVALAGDAFDGRIVDHVVAPALGLGTRYRSHLDGKVMTVPGWIFARLRRWHHLSFLKSRETMHFLEELLAQSDEPKKIAALIDLVEHDRGYDLYKAVEGTKLDLSHATQSRFLFHDPPIDIEAAVQRGELETWLAEELGEIGACVDRLLAAASVPAGEVDRVFMTGGSSFVPSVRRIFERRFGAERLRGGDEMTSVALGLSLRARDLELR
ncbi:MAG: Hsp70 family protein [Myxococcales bacterium]|nr:Hsp70 family protein [Myxococcales bacterium]